MNHPPKKIYLQFYDDDGGTQGEITWSVNQINESDIEYIRLTERVETALKLLDELDNMSPDLKALAEMAGKSGTVHSRGHDPRIDK